VKNPRANRNFDILGGVIFTIATTALLIGLTYKGLTDPATHQLYEWTAGVVGGLIALGLSATCLHLGRGPGEGADRPAPPVPEPDVRSLDGRTFFAAFAFFGASSSCRAGSRFVQGYTPTFSGLAALPLMVGLDRELDRVRSDRRAEPAATSG
jgi:hypothetical protein